MKHNGIREYSSITYIPGLDGVRAISIIAVMLFHFTAPYSTQLQGSITGLNVFAKVFSLGWVGVDIFFVISGYLISKLTIKNPIESVSKYCSFIKRRAWRLLPAYIICMLVFSAISITLAHGSKVFDNSYFLWTMTSNIESSFGDRSAFVDRNFSLVHFWSLAVEWHFYLLFPIFIWKANSVTKVAFLLIFTAILVRVQFYNLSLSDNAIYSFTLCRMDSFAFGCLLATPQVERYKFNSKTIGVVGAVLFITIMAVVANTEMPFKMIPWMQTWGYTAIAMSVAMMLFNIINASASSVLIKWFENLILKTIGRASYSIYIWHLVFHPWVNQLFVGMFSSLSLQYLSSMFTSFIVSTILGMLSYKLIEIKFQSR